ncbi:hypothetical protein ONZ45_g5631 [Pleurotus djamor]|nr:hypothetical protein ONZ45_g5631 [Pleurotus djamor]
MPTEPSSQESTDVQQTMDDDKEKQVDVIEAVASPEPQQHQYPDGGLRAWLTVLGAFLSQTTTIGQVDILVAKHPNITFTFTLCGQHLSSLPLALGIVSHYFHKRRALAMGIVAAGTSCGAILHPIMLNQLFNGSVGFHNGVRASAGMNLGLLLLANLLMKPRLPPKKGGMSFPVNEFLRDPPYVFAMISGAVCMMAIFFPIFFLQLYVIQHDMDRQFAFYSISILNAASFLGRILPGFFVHYTGVFNQMIIHTAVIIAVMFCLLAVSNVAGVVCFAIFFGFFSGAAITLTPPMIATLARDFSDIGARLGLCFTVAGFAGLISAPVAGALLTGEYIWWRAILFAGLLLTLGELLMIAARVFVVRRTGSQKV